MTKRIASILAGLVISLAVIESARLFQPITNWKLGILLLAMAIISLIILLFVPQDRPSSPNQWSGRQQRDALIVFSMGAALFGLALLVWAWLS